MTVQTFRNKITGVYKTDNVINYVTCIIFIFGGLFLLFKIIQGKYTHIQNSSALLVILIPLMPIALGVYGIWRIRQDYIVTSFYSNASIDKKSKVVDEYLSNVKVLFRSKDGNYYSYRYRNRFFMLVDLRVYLDDDKILFNVMGGDSSSLKGIIDFGLTKRAIKRFENYLIDCL